VILNNQKVMHLLIILLAKPEAKKYITENHIDLHKIQLKHLISITITLCLLTQFVLGIENM